MLKHSRTFHRPNPSIPWHWELELNGFEEYKNHFNTVYDPFVVYRTRQAIDENTNIAQLLWVDATKHSEWWNDPVCTAYWASRDEYNESVGITMDPVEITTI